MKLIETIINELADSGIPLSSPLLKTKILATKLNNNEILKWVNKEINGYPEIEELPSYRINACSIIGDFHNGGLKYSNYPLPFDFGKESNKVHTFHFQEGISILETYLKEKNTRVSWSFHASAVAIIEKEVRKAGNPSFVLFSVRKSAPISAIRQVLLDVRSRLLDFMLKLDSEFGGLDVSKLNSENNLITKYMSQIIITTNGDGNIVNTGNDSNITATITVNSGDLESLKSKLLTNGVDAKDVEELAAIVVEEKPDFINGKFGDRVNGWAQKMIAKSLDGTWQVSVAVAGGLIVEGIKAFYGMK